MRSQHTGRAQRLRYRRPTLRRPDDSLDRLDRNPTRPQQHRSSPAEIQHRALQPDRTGPAIEHCPDTPIQIRQHMRGRNRAHPARPVGRRRRHRPPHSAQQRPRRLVRRHPHRQRRQPRPRQQIHRAAEPARQNQGQRSRPESLGKLRRQRPGQNMLEHRLGISKMTDERVKSRPPFGRKNSSDSPPIGRVPAEAIDSLGPKRDELPRLQETRSLRDPASVCWETECHKPAKGQGLCPRATGT